MLRKYLPDLFEFKSLFPKQQRGQNDGIGFPEGSTILISGPPGSGKSTFALAFVRSLIVPEEGKAGNDSDAEISRIWKLENKNSRVLKSKARLYYISTEATQSRLARAFADMGWFADEDLLFNKETGILKLVVPKMDIERPARRSEDLVNEIFNRIRTDLMTNVVKGLRPFVVVDSLTALLKDCKDRGEERRQTHEFIRRLETVFRENLHPDQDRDDQAVAAFTDDEELGSLGESPGSTENAKAALTFFISEENSGPQPAVPVEDYVVDIVFRLYLQDMGFGRRLRSLEMLKSHGTYLSPGEHTWAILAKNGCRFVIYQNDLQQEIERQARRLEVFKAPGKSSWGTIAIFPRLVLSPAPELPAGGISASYDERRMVHSGVPGLDEMLRNDADYWAHDEADQNIIFDPTQGEKRGLLPGSTSLVLGGAGTGKTTMCLQFLLSERLAGIARKKNADGSELKYEKTALYVNFENNFEEVVKRYPDDTITERDFAHCAKVYRRRGSLDVNLLFAEIRWIVRNRKNRIRRVALDGLSSLLVTTPPGQYAILVEGLLQSIHQAGRTRSEDIKNEALAKAHFFDREISRLAKDGAGNADPLVKAFRENLKMVEAAEETSRKFFEDVDSRIREGENAKETAFKKENVFTDEEVSKLVSHFGAVEELGKLVTEIVDSCDKWAAPAMGGEVRARLERAAEGFESAARPVPGTEDVLKALEELKSALKSASLETLKEKIAAARGAMASFWDDSISVLVTYEVDTIHPLDAISQLSATADNVVVLQPVSVNDTRFTAVTIPKARNLEHDRSVRQVKIEKVRQQDSADHRRVPLVIERGLEGFSDVTKGQPKPVKVVLQLFSENETEKKFNNDLTAQLDKTFGYDVRLYGFSRSDIAIALKDAVASASRVPAGDLKILSVDEWWIHEHFAEERHPLLKLAAFEHHTMGSQVNTHQSDFWSWEIGKAMQVKVKKPGNGPRPEGAAGDIETALLAVPNYMDFGMFCVNTGCPTKLPGPEDQNKSDEARVKAQMNEWAGLVQQIPRCWVARDKAGWFEAPDASQNTDTLMGHISRNRKSFKWGFVYDMQTRETAICAYMEFVWSFGAGERFLMELAGEWLQRSHGQNPRQPERASWRAYLAEHPAVTATKFLMYMVYHQVMPWRAKLSDVPEAIFSRHFYSTFIEERVEHRKRLQTMSGISRLSQKDALSLTFTLDFLRKLDLEGLCRETTDFYLKPLPFFPIGCSPTSGALSHVYPAFQSVVRGFVRLMTRVADALAYRSAPEEKLKSDVWVELTERYVKTEILESDAEDFARKAVGQLLRKETSLDEKSIRECLGLVKDDAEKLRRFSWTCPELMPGGIIHKQGRSTRASRKPKTRTSAHSFAMDMRDITELIECHLLRCVMLETVLGAASASQEKDGSQKRTPLEVAGSCGSAGHACAGSWAVGVLNNTHSPVLSSKIIEEITSLQSAHRRSKLGAGFPARKDFYEYYGSEPVPGAPYLSWQELFRMCKSRARRRDRALCPMIPTSRTFDLIHRNVMTALAEAEECRVRKNPDAVDYMKNVALDTVNNIIEGIGMEIIAVTESMTEIACACSHCATQEEAARHAAKA